MSQLVMFPGLVNSPETTTTTSISAIDTQIAVLDIARIPTDLPNLLVLGTGTNAETVKVTAIDDGTGIITVVRGFQGVAKDWLAGTVIARNFTAYDYDALRENVEDLNDQIVESQYEVDAHKAEGATDNDLPHGATSAATAYKIVARDSTGKTKAKNNASVTDGIWATTEYQGENITSDGSRITSTAVLDDRESYLLFVSVIGDANIGDLGVYAIGRVGTTAKINTIIAITNISVSIDVSYHVVITNNTGGPKGIRFTLIKA